MIITRDSTIFHHQNQQERTSIAQKWQKTMQQAIRSPKDLLSALNLSDSLLSKEAIKDFSLFVPSPFLKRIQKGNPQDPLLKQVLPVHAETEMNTAFSRDPLNEKDANIVKGLLHKYTGRVLIFPSTFCAVNCRYCFRRHFPYKANQPSRKEWQDVFHYIEKNPHIHEVIYSGGDPLTLNDRRLSWLTNQIASISHIQRLRIHTRLPIMIPERVNDTLLGWMTETRLKVVMVVHCNHANEIDEEVIQAFQKLKKAQISLLNQSVLLKGINDSVYTLKVLHEKLFHNDVLPYYLHLLDKVQGASHFYVAESEAKKLMKKLHTLSSGYLIPRLVKEESWQQGKTWIHWL